MSKLLSILMAGAAALAMNGAVLAQDQARDPGTSGAEQYTEEAEAGRPAQREGSPTHTPEAQGTPQGQEQTDSQAQGGHPGQHDEYAAALKQCETMTGSQRDRCVKKAKKDHGQM